jgi:hypothetical protein
MIATQTPPPISWTEQGERLRASVIHAADAVAGPPPRRLGTPSRQPALAVGALARQAALWGVALGLLAPATTALVLVSGLGADDVRLVGSTDLGFFFGFVPLLTALVVMLLSLNHWPLRDLRTYHRELSVGMLLVGAVTFVGLRAHGAAVTGDDWDHDWLFANGSLVLHVLVTWCLVRLATNDLTALHARRAGWRVPAVAAGARPVRRAELAWDAPRHLATLALAFRSVVWGVIVGTAAGAAAGTVVSPGPGTLAGGYLGAIYGLVPTVTGTALLVTVISWRRDTDPRAIGSAVRVTLTAVSAGTLAGAWVLLHSAPQVAMSWPTGHPERPWLMGAVVVVLLLRQAAPRLTAAYVERIRPADHRPPHPRTPPTDAPQADLHSPDRRGTGESLHRSQPATWPRGSSPS